MIYILNAQNEVAATASWLSVQ